MKTLNDLTPYIELLTQISRTNELLEKVPSSERFLQKGREQMKEMTTTVIRELLSELSLSVPTQDVVLNKTPSPAEESTISTPERVVECAQEIVPVQEEIFTEECGISEENEECGTSEENEECGISEENPTTEPSEELLEENVEEDPVEEDPVEEDPVTPPATIQISPSEWSIDAKRVLYQKQEVTITTKEGKDLPVKLTISPLEIKDGLVPLMVNAEYTNATYRQVSTFKSEAEESLLTIEIGGHSLLLNGRFVDGKFSVSVMTTGGSVENGDILRVENVFTNKGTVPVQEIALHQDATLWISFAEDQYFGILISGEWLDEYNANHDVMVEQGGDFSELILAHDAMRDRWILNF